MANLRALVITGCLASLVSLAAFPLAGDSPTEPQEYAAVLAYASCAPWDGPAVAIGFYTSPARCGEAKSSRLNINLWRGLPLKAGQRFELARATSVGSASFCPRENQCEAAESGSVWIESHEPGKSISGHYEFAFKKAGRVAAKFRANWCDLRQRCG